MMKGARESLPFELIRSYNTRKLTISTYLPNELENQGLGFEDETVTYLRIACVGFVELDAMDVRP